MWALSANKLSGGKGGSPKVWICTPPTPIPQGPGPGPWGIGGVGCKSTFSGVWGGWGRVGGGVLGYGGGGVIPAILGYRGGWGIGV